MKVTLSWLLFAPALTLVAANPAAEIPSVLQRLNAELRDPKSAHIERFFTVNASYRDAFRQLSGSARIAELFLERRPFSERTPPQIEGFSIRELGVSAALVDALVVQYGSTMLKAQMPVVLVFRYDGTQWKIEAWRSLTCGADSAAQVL